MRVKKHNIQFLHWFVSNGFEMPMTNQAFDLLWNSFANQEVFDIETSSASAEGDKATSSVGKGCKYWMEKQDDGEYNKKPNDENYFKTTPKRRRNRNVYATYAVKSHAQVCPLVFLRFSTYFNFHLFPLKFLARKPKQN